jgi:hypothetical protein
MLGDGKRKFTGFIDLRSGLDIPQRRGSQYQMWVRAVSDRFMSEDEERRFLTWLKESDLTWLAMERIIERRYMDAQQGKVHNEILSMTEALIYSQGYKDALIDIHSTIPRPHGEE